MIAAQDAWLLAKERAEYCKGAKDSMVHKRDMLIQIGGDLRQERSLGNPSLREQAREMVRAASAA